MDIWKLKNNYNDIENSISIHFFSDIPLQSILLHIFFFQCGHKSEKDFKVQVNNISR